MVIELGRKLNLTVIAEEVEDEGQATTLNSFRAVYFVRLRIMWVKRVTWFVPQNCSLRSVTYYWLKPEARCALVQHLIERVYAYRRGRCNI